MNPWLYQLLHPWHWLTYGQNAAAFGILIATAVNLLAVFVLIRTLSAVNRQAKASDRQAAAAEEQVNAAKAATAVSDAQRIATEEGARAEREHSELIRQQLLATLRPIVVIVRRTDKLGNITHLVENYGEGVALFVKLSYRGKAEELYLSHDILGPNQSALTALDHRLFEAEGVQARYQSQDGRMFVTTAFGKGPLEVRQSTIEVDAHGGHVPQPPIT
jgi:ribosome-binding ATPase YchF (GTP1/OBG family)